jgi:signal transduction histidine kinase
MRYNFSYLSTRFACAALLLCAIVFAAPLEALQRRRLDSLRTMLHEKRTTLSKNSLADLLNDLSLAYNPYLADSALAFGLEALAVAEGARYVKGKADAYRNVAFAHQRLGKLIDATAYYLRAMPLFESLNDSLGLANVWNGLGICYFEQGDYQNALAYYQRAEATFARLQIAYRYAAALSNIGYTYLQMDNLHLSQMYARRALAITDTIDAPLIRVFTLSHLGEIARRMKNYNLAGEYLARSLALAAENPENTVANSHLYYLLGKYYTDRKDFQKAKLYLDSSLAISQRAQMRFRIKDALEGFQRLYETMQDYKHAYEYQHLVGLYQDSLFNQESARQIAAILRSVEVTAQQTQIALLQKDNEFQQFTRNVLIVVLLGGLLSGALVVRALWQTRRANAALQTKNREIEEQRSILEKQAEEIAFINQELQEKNRYLENLNEDKSQFLRIAAHDLKNPLTSIRSLAEYLTMEASSLPVSEVRLLASRIEQTASRMFQLVKNFLDVNAIESGGFALNIVDFNASCVVETTVQSFMDAAKAKDITLRLTMTSATMTSATMTSAAAQHSAGEAEEEFFVRADEQAFMQIVDNIVSNAIKYSPLGKNIFICLQRERANRNEKSNEKPNDKNAAHASPQSKENAKEWIRLEVQDEGQGLSESDKKLLFGKFTKLSARPTGGEDSTGMGLAIVKQLVEMMQGEVWCESEYGKGATFIVRLPASPKNSHDNGGASSPIFTHQSNGAARPNAATLSE